MISEIKSSKGTSPEFFSGQPAKEGTILLFAKAILRPEIISSCVNSPSSMNLIKRSSSPSAAAPARTPNASSYASLKSSGISAASATLRAFYPHLRLVFRANL